jgi:PAS domain-containing protein
MGPDHDHELRAIRAEAARLREVLDLLGAAVVIIDRSTEEPRVVHRNLPAVQLFGRSTDLGELMGHLPSEVREQATSALHDAAEPRSFGSHRLLGSAAQASVITVLPLEADLHESVAIVVIPDRSG